MAIGHLMVQTLTMPSSWRRRGTSSPGSSPDPLVRSPLKCPFLSVFSCNDQQLRPGALGPFLGDFAGFRPRVLHFHQQPPIINAGVEDNVTSGGAGAGRVDVSEDVNSGSLHHLKPSGTTGGDRSSMFTLNVNGIPADSTDIIPQLDSSSDFPAIDLCVEPAAAPGRVDPAENTIRKLRAYAEKVRAGEFKKLLGKLVKERCDLTPEDKRVIEEMSRDIVNKLLHAPMSSLKCDGRHSNALERIFELHSDDPTLMEQAAVEDHRSSSGDSGN